MGVDAQHIKYWRGWGDYNALLVARRRPHEPAAGKRARSQGTDHDDSRRQFESQPAIGLSLAAAFAAPAGELASADKSTAARSSAAAIPFPAGSTDVEARQRPSPGQEAQAQQEGGCRAHEERRAAAARVKKAPTKFVLSQKTLAMKFMQRKKVTDAQRVAAVQEQHRQDTWEAAPEDDAQDDDGSRVICTRDVPDPSLPLVFWPPILRRLQQGRGGRVQGGLEGAAQRGVRGEGAPRGGLGRGDDVADAQVHGAGPPQRWQQQERRRRQAP
ncbi:hypothetical protein ON010_g17607 [Phytophthora cinnamomi]|nr:hypothetical protein ON010_g17607 [Phytophthora cinnamomi]